MAHSLWNEQFISLYHRCLKAFQAGNTDFQTYYDQDDLAFLNSIGCQPREFFDFVEDHSDALPMSTALLVAAVRRAYFLRVQNGVPSQRPALQAEQLPARESMLGGIPWLPRILPKARAKLRGELHPDLMYGCGGDRRFLASHDIPMADFLHAVWDAGDDDGHVLEYVLAAKK